MPTTSIPAVLLLADGTVAHGQAFGAIGTTTGEICFNTGMTGYQEVFTDPSYFGQILIMNSAHIGNYGVKEADVESDSVKINGLIGRNLEELYSRKLSNGSLNEYLKTNKIERGVADYFDVVKFVMDFSTDSLAQKRAAKP